MTFGLNQYTSGSLTQMHPRVNERRRRRFQRGCAGPDEAALDVEWASAAAPRRDGGAVVRGHHGTFGGFIALQNLF